MGTHLEDHEVVNLYHDLRGAPTRVQFAARRAMPDFSRRIEREMKVDAGGHRYLSHLPTAVSWEMLTQFESEIGLGPKRGTQGSLAHIIAHGSINNAPVYDYMAGPRRALPSIEQSCADLAEKSVFGGEK